MGSTDTAGPTARGISSGGLPLEDAYRLGGGVRDSSMVWLETLSNAGMEFLESRSCLQLP